MLYLSLSPPPPPPAKTIMVGSSAMNGNTWGEHAARMAEAVAGPMPLSWGPDRMVTAPSTSPLPAAARPSRVRRSTVLASLLRTRFINGRILPRRSFHCMTWTSSSLVKYGPSLAAAARFWRAAGKVVRQNTSNLGSSFLLAAAMALMQGS